MLSTNQASGRLMTICVHEMALWMDVAVCIQVVHAHAMTGMAEFDHESSPCNNDAIHAAIARGLSPHMRLAELLHLHCNGHFMPNAPVQARCSCASSMSCCLMPGETCILTIYQTLDLLPFTHVHNT